MKHPLRSFYARISLLFLLLILLLGSASLITAFNASRHLFDEVEQLLNREYASSIAGELQPILKDGFSEEKIKEAIHYMMVLNPMVEIYLLNEQGRILSYFTHPEESLERNSIAVEPLRRFIASDGWEIIQGDDPRTEKEEKPFSAAALPMGDSTGFVYVILRGQSYDKSLASAGNNYYFRTGLYIFSGALLFTIITGLILFFLLTRRLRLLARGVRAFEQGNLEYRVNISGRDELGELGSTFNDMARTIQKGMEDLKKAKKERTDLIANISHDLRSPLTSIRGHLETLFLKEPDLSREEKKQFLEITLKNVSAFQNLVEELFDLARLESRQYRIKKETFSLAELVQDVIIKLRPLGESKKIEINFAPPGLIPLSGDISLLERVITNILINSITHTPEQGKIDISLTEKNDSVEWRIQDSGPGIPAEDLPRIFDRFYRADKSRNRTGSGTGLGLAIAREIVTLHKGTLRASNGRDGGAVFSMTLPKEV